jgi:hypothetical protein
MRSVPGAILTLLLFSVVTAAAQPHPHSFGVDQRNDFVLTTQGYVSPVGDPIGQEFRPTFLVLDVVELQMNSQSNEEGGTAIVRIRAGSITGTILGTSDEVTIPPVVSPQTLAHFDFAAPVPVTPEATHVIEVVATSGTLGVFTSGFLNNSYPRGAAIFMGVRQVRADLWFREGLEAALPVENTTWGNIKALYVN